MSAEGEPDFVTKVMEVILPWSGSRERALAWYCSQPIPAFGDQTAEELVREGCAEHLLSYLAGLSVGG